MNKTPISPLLLLLTMLLPSQAEDLSTPPPAPPAPPATTPTEISPPDSEGRFALEFRGARLGQVLDYLSKQAGFVVTSTLELPMPITLVAKQPVTPAEAVDALNSVLIEQGYAAIMRGKNLRVVTLPTARQQNLPVLVGADPERIPETDRMATQIIPVQYATAKDLADNLQALLNTTSATLSANESSNVLILTDTQANARRIVAIVQAIDRSISGELQVKVFHLAFAEAEKVAQVINNVYGNRQSSSNRNNNNQDAMARMFGGGRGGGGGGGNSGGGGNANQGNAAGSRGVEVAASADSGTNSVVVRAPPSAMTAVTEVVAQLDMDTSARDGVLVYRVRNGKATDLAKSLNDLFTGVQSQTSSSSASSQRGTTQNRQVPATATRSSGAASAATPNSALDLTGQVRVVADTTSNSVLVLSPERNFDRLRKILTEMDQALRQVLVRVLVAEVTLEDGLDLGVELQGFNTDTNKSRSFSSFNIFDSSTAPTGLSTGPGGLGLNGFLLNSTDFQATIRALSSTSRFDVLSRPYVMTTDNQKATINVSQNVPIVTGSRTDVNNNVTITSDRQDVGIILTVTPQINSEGNVVLDVSQELSALTDQTIPVGNNVPSPIIKKRTMTTRVTMDNGQTVVVGGLVHDELKETVRKIPLLGDIPFLGALFRRTISSKIKTELLVFLTPQVVKNPSDLTDLSLQLRNEMQRLNAAVEEGLLQHHLDQLAKLKIGESLILPPVDPVKAEKPTELRPRGTL